MIDNEKKEDLKKVKDQVDGFIQATQEARELSERDRDYYNHIQWSDEEINVLKSRKQAPIVVNRIRPKVEGLKGLYSLKHTDPKAYPRTMKHENAAHAITDALRYVADNNDFENEKMTVAESYFIEGCGGFIIAVDEQNKNEITIDCIPWDMIYYDPNSRRKDHKDSRFMGMYVWLDLEEAKERFPDQDIDDLFSKSKGVFEQSDKACHWVDKGNKRLRVAQHYFIKGGVWHECIFTDQIFLQEPAPSMYLGENGEPSCPIELASAYVDRHNMRSGEVRTWIDLQNEINHRRSKALHLLSSRQTMSTQGAVKDVASLKRELKKPDGHINVNGDSGSFQILPTNDMQASQLGLYQESKQELDAISYNAQLAGERSNAGLSGRAIEKLQMAGTIEINGLFGGLASLEKRVYRQVWARIKQFWNDEKWIRVTDDKDSMKFIGFNVPYTVQDFLEETINDESKPDFERQQAAATYQALIANNDPTLSQVVGNRNDVAELDVDVIVERGQDSISIQQEQFEMLAQFANSGEIDIIDLLQLSQLRGKDDLIEKIESRRAAQSESAGGANNLETSALMAKVKKDMADTALIEQKAISQQIDNIKATNSQSDVAELQEKAAKTLKTQQEAIQKSLENQALSISTDPDPQVIV